MGATGATYHKEGMPQGIVISVLLHGAMLVALAFVAPESLLDPPEENQIEVEIISADMLRPIEKPPSPNAFPAAPAPPSPEKSKDEMIRPGKMLSAGLLAHPENADGRRDFSDLADDEKREQLCALEALEQIRAWDQSYHPLRIVSYTFAEVRYEDTHILADGATFWSHDNWHRVKYDCELSNDQKTVTRFAFQVGVIVPKDQWETYNLTRYK